MAKISERVTDVARRTVVNAGNRMLAAEGRRSFTAKAHTARKVTRKAVKAGAVTGLMVAAMIVARENKKRRKLSS